MEKSDEKSLSAREYRLIPIDEEREKTSDNAVDMVELYHTLRDRSGLIKKIVLFFFIAGLAAAIINPNEFLSEAVLMPETKSSSTDAGSLLQTYGGVLGLGGLGSLSEGKEGVIPPQVYPMIVNSPAFIDYTLREEIYFSELDTTITGYKFFEEFYKPTLFELIANYSIKLPSKIFGPQYPPVLPDWLAEEIDAERAIQLSDRELEIVKKMIKRIEVDLNVETGVLNMSILFPDRAAAAQLNRNMIERLKYFVEEYSTQKAKEDLAFTEIQYEQAQQFFDEAQEDLVSFLDKNTNISSARLRGEEQKLMAEFDIAYGRYQNVSDRLLEARVKVQEFTPVFKTIQEINVPTTANQPKRLIIIILSVIAGFVVSFLWIAGADVVQNIKRKL